MKGSCLCGRVTYEVDPPFKVFQYCHCSRCQKSSGTAHAANLFVDPVQFRWTSGEEYTSRYEVPDAKYFAKCFCKNCGSSLPWLAKGGKNLVIPAGSLDESPDIRPQHIVFWDSKATWYIEPEHLQKFAELPIRK